jgi:hypothetical protein
MDDIAFWYKGRWLMCVCVGLVGWVGMEGDEGHGWRCGLDGGKGLVREASAAVTKGLNMQMHNKMLRGAWCVSWYLLYGGLWLLTMDRWGG